MSTKRKPKKIVNKHFKDFTLAELVEQARDMGCTLTINLVRKEEREEEPRAGATRYLIICNHLFLYKEAIKLAKVNERDCIQITQPQQLYGLDPKRCVIVLHGNYRYNRAFLSEPYQNLIHHGTRVINFA